jgi:hypothetical protein
MKRALKITSWIVGILTCIVVLMLVIAMVYDVPLGGLYEDIFKPILVIWVASVLAWLLIYVPGTFNGKFDNLL